jgi:hypothetical protein
VDLERALRVNTEVLRVAWRSDMQTLEIPIVDVTNPAFTLDDNSTTRAQLQQLYESEEQRQAKVPGVVRALTMRVGARQSKLLHGLVHAKSDHLGGLHTYLMKLGADNLPPGSDSPIDRKIAASPHAASMRLRLQQCATLLAEGLQEALAQSPSKPLHLINIAGGTAIDTLNALILLQTKDPLLLRRPIRIFVLDIDDLAPAFGAMAASMLTATGNVLSGLDLHFEHHRYDWNDTRLLLDHVEQSHASRAILAASSEGGLFEYGSDSAIIANLQALAVPQAEAEVIVGSVTCSDLLRRASIKRARFKIVPRGVEGIRTLGDRAGLDLARFEHTPLSDQVAFRPKTVPGRGSMSVWPVLHSS